MPETLYHQVVAPLAAAPSTFAGAFITKTCSNPYDGLGVVINGHPGKTIQSIGYTAGTLTGTSPTFDARLEALSGQVPSNILMDSSAHQTFTIAGSGNYSAWVDLISPYAVPLSGQCMCAMIRYSSGTIDNSNKADFRHRQSFPLVSGLPLPVASISGAAGYSYSYNTSISLVTVRHTDGTILYGTGTINAASENSYNSGSTPDEYGNKWVQPWNGLLTGISCQLRFVDASSTAQFGIYLLDGTKLSTDAELLVPSSDYHSITANISIYLPITPIRLTKGKTYVVSARATTASSLSLGKITSQDEYGHSQVFTNFREVSRKGTGAFTSSSGSVSRIIFPFFSRIDENTGYASGGIS